MNFSLSISVLFFFLFISSCKTSQVRDVSGQEISSLQEPLANSSAAVTPITPLANPAVSFTKVPTDIAFLEQDEFWTARWKLLNRAKRSVRIQTFIFDPDESGLLMSRKLIQLKKKGIDVRVIVDPVFNHKPEVQNIYAEMQNAGIPVKGFELGYGGFVDMLTRARNFGDLFQNGNMRHHEKLFIVDAEDLNLARAIVGGTNIGNEYFRVEKEDYTKMWHDRDILLKGPIVAQMAQAFERNARDLDVNLNSQSAGSLASIGQGISKLLQNDTQILNRDKIRKRLQKAGARNQFEPEFHRSSAQFFLSRPRYNEDIIHPLHLSLIANTKTRLDIVNSYMIPDAELINALRQAAAREVKVRILTNHIDATDVSQVVTLARSRYAQLLSTKGISIYEWGGHKTLNNKEGLNHAKYMVSDRTHVIVGSYNLDHRSRYLNSESVVAFSKAKLARKFVDEFSSWIQPKYSHRVTKAQAQKFQDFKDEDSFLERTLAEFMGPFL